MNDSSDSNSRRISFPGILRKHRLLVRMTQLWSAIQMLALAPVVVLVADAIWGFWQLPAAFTQIASLWAIFITVYFPTCFLFVLSGVKAKRYRLAADVVEGMFIGCEGGQPIVEQLLELRIKMASQIILKYGIWIENYI